MDFFLLIAGFILLIKGSDYLVDGALNVSKFFKVPSILIGLTLVSFGTSLPELSVSIMSAVDGKYGITVGNILGSNIFNLLMIVGAAGVVQTLLIHDSIISKQFNLLIFSSIIVMAMFVDGIVTRYEGLFLLSLFGYFVYYIISGALKSPNSTFDYYESFVPKNRLTFFNTKQNSILSSLILLLFGLIGIIVGGNLVVSASVSIASLYGVSDELIGFTIIAMGTSLPELITTLVAATKGDSGIALGSILGSNLFNILFITGASSIVSPLTVSPSMLTDGIFMIIVTAIAYLFACRKHDISKFESATLMLIYTIYLFDLISTI